MARKNQKLINFHGSVKANLEAAKAQLALGEIAVVHSGQTDSYLAIKDGANADLVYFVSSGAVSSAIDSATGGASQELGQRIDTLSGAVSSITNTYATSANTVALVGAVSGATLADAYASAGTAEANAKAYADTASGNIKTTYDAKFEADGQRIDAVSGSVSALSEHLASDYATSADTYNAITGANATALESAYASAGTAEENAKTYVGTVSGYIKTTYDAKFEADGQRIDAVSGSVSALSEHLASDYATSADTVSAIGVASGAAVQAAYASAGTAEENAKTYTDGKISGLSQSLQGQIDSVDEKADTLSGSVSALSAHLASDYATSADTHNAITGANATALESAYASAGTAEANAKSYTDTVSGYIKTTYDAKFEADGQRIDAVSGSVSALSAHLTADYATSADTYNAITGANATALESAYASAGTAEENAKTYANTVSGYIKTTYDAKFEADGQRIDAVSGSVSALSADVKSYIDTKLSSVYDYKGSKDTVADLPSTGNKTGDVWNVVSADTTNNVPAGTNYAWDGAKWDALGGFVDLTDFATKGEVASAKTDTGAVEQKVDSLSGVVTAFSAYVVTTYATSANTVSAIGAASGAAVQAAYASAGTAEANAKAYADTASGNIKTTYDAMFEADRQRLSNLEAISGKTNSAIQSVVIASGKEAAVSATTENNVVTFDFSGLVIDCGDF